MNKWFFRFEYDKWGHGDLVLHEGNIPVFEYRCRTGSISKSYKLQNAIKPGIWSVREPSVITTEEAMIVDPAIEARKIRLYTPANKWSHYLIHADGGKPGSLGCVVTDVKYGNAPGLFVYIDNVILKHQSIIPAYINTPVPEEVYNGTA